MPHYGWYYLTYLLPALVAWGIYAGGWMLWIAPLWTFVLVPIYDHLRGTEKGNLKPESEASYSANVGYNLVVWLWPFMQAGLLAAAFARIYVGGFEFWELVAMAFSVGIITGAVGITWAHELCHRTNLIERALAEITLYMVCYPHFCVEHVYGHHKNVATPQDPATSRLGESFYRFYFRCVWGSLKSAWQIEAQQMKKKRKPMLHYSNRMVRYLIVQLLIVAAVYYLFGGIGLVFFIVQSIVAFTLLELINYLEHYGLLRKQNDQGRYETVRPWHSWNSSHIVSNLSLINLARHSDHHFRASRRYQILRHFEEAPQLPSGYSAMLVMALVPPLWFRIMNPRVREWRETHYIPAKA